MNTKIHIQNIGTGSLVAKRLPKFPHQSICKFTNRPHRECPSFYSVKVDQEVVRAAVKISPKFGF